MMKTPLEPRRSKHAIVSELAAQIRALYISARRMQEENMTGKQSRYNPGTKWDGGFDSYTKRNYKSAWLDLAEFFLEKKIDPQPYIYFQIVNNYRRIPEPNQLKASANLASYREFKDNEVETLALALKLQKQALFSAAYEVMDTVRINNLGYGVNRIRSMVLSDQSATMTALFRYCVAVKQDLPEVARRYKPAAVLQYRWAKEAYDETWKDELPPGFAEEAEQTVAGYLQEV